MASQAASLFCTLVLVLFAHCTRAIPALDFSRHQQQPLVPVNHGELATWSNCAKIRQNDSVCDAGSSQWTGHISLGPDRNMFYWYFESRNDPKEAPLVIWVNGGPGASAMLGAFFELGPCIVTPQGNETTRNPQAWTEFANMLFIDQPIGVGFSKSANKSSWTDTLLEGAMDIDRFLDVFTTQLFPDLSDRSIHFAGESFGGKYVPVYTAAARRRFASVILVDPFVDPSSHLLGLFEHFCPLDGDAGREAAPPNRYFNETTCAGIEEAYQPCETIATACRASYDETVCNQANQTCFEGIGKILEDEMVPGGRDPYDDRRKCGKPPLCGGVGELDLFEFRDSYAGLLEELSGMEQVVNYLNSTLVKRALQLSDDFDYEALNFELNMEWSESPAATLPSTREITALLDRKHTRVLVINGNNDAIINSEGIIRIFDNLPWSGHARFQRLSYQPWYWVSTEGEKKRGGSFKSSQGLSVVTVDEAGHMSPQNQPEATLNVMRRWIVGADLSGYMGV